MNIDIGSNFLGFKIVKIIGNGGFGTVYLGEKVNLTSTFPYTFAAIKILHEFHSIDEKKVHRFHREARLAMKLSHPNVIQIFEDGEYDGMHYIIMEYAKGKTLLEYINSELLDDASFISEECIDEEKTITFSSSNKTVNLTSFSEDENATVTLKKDDETKWLIKDDFIYKPKWEQACILMEQCAEVLSLANQIGLLHRDIKPENILISKNNSGKMTVKILDFGLVKDTCQETMQISIEGQALGTPAYMSPEQFEGLELDIRSDLYSLGATFYSFLTKEKPFKANLMKELMQQVLFKEPKDIISFDSSINHNVAFLIKKLLRKNRNERYQTPLKLIDDIRKILRGEDIYEFKKVSKLRKRVSFIIVAVFCAFAFSFSYNYAIKKSKIGKNKKLEITSEKELISKKNIEIKNENKSDITFEVKEKIETIVEELPLTDNDVKILENTNLINKEEVQPTSFLEQKVEEKKDFIVGFGDDFKDSKIQTKEKDRFQLIKEKSNR